MSGLLKLLVAAFLAYALWSFLARLRGDAPAGKSPDSDMPIRKSGMEVVVAESVDPELSKICEEAVNRQEFSVLHNLENRKHVLMIERGDLFYLAVADLAAGLSGGTVTVEDAYLFDSREDAEKMAENLEKYLIHRLYPKNPV